ncbi:MAG: hypothetical protein WED05_08140 [Candidatus Atabeyarchaeum deiterrae]
MSNTSSKDDSMNAFIYFTLVVQSTVVHGRIPTQLTVFLEFSADGSLLTTIIGSTLNDTTLSAFT